MNLESQIFTQYNLILIHYLDMFSMKILMQLILVWQIYLQQIVKGMWNFGFHHSVEFVKGIYNIKN